LPTKAAEGQPSLSWRVTAMYCFMPVPCGLHPLVLDMGLLVALPLLYGGSSNSLGVLKSLGFPALQRWPAAAFSHCWNLDFFL